MIDSSYLLVCAIAFVAMFGGGLIGIFAARTLPEHHLSASSATVVKLAAAVVVSLAPADRRQTALLTQAQFLIDNVYAERWLLWENPGSTVPAQFLFAPANLTVMASFFLSALAVAGAVLLILELGDPVHHGWFQVSNEPMRRAVIEIGRP